MYSYSVQTIEDHNILPRIARATLEDPAWVGLGLVLRVRVRVWVSVSVSVRVRVWVSATG